MGAPDGIMTADESGFPGKGDDSAGVAGQYRRCPGKVGNSQVGVSAAYAPPRGYAPADKRLFIPDKRSGDGYAVGEKSAEYPENRYSGPVVSD